MQTTKTSILAKAAMMLGLGALSGGPAGVSENGISFAENFRPTGRGRSRTPGPRRPAGSKLARMASERRIGIGHKG
jgi:hypothetical protein